MRELAKRKGAGEGLNLRLGCTGLGCKWAGLQAVLPPAPALVLLATRAHALLLLLPIRFPCPARRGTAEIPVTHAILAEERGSTAEQPADPTQTLPFPDALLQVGWVVQVRAGGGRGTPREC